MCLTQGHHTVTPVRLEPTALRSQVKHSITEPLRSLIKEVNTMNPDQTAPQSDLGPYCLQYRLPHVYKQIYEL